MEQLCTLRMIRIVLKFHTGSIVNNVEITVTVLSHPVPNFHIVGIYRSKLVKILQLMEALTHLHYSVLMECTIPTVLLGESNINLMQEDTEQKALKAFLIVKRGYTQLINQCTTDLTVHR